MPGAEGPRGTWVTGALPSPGRHSGEGTRKGGTGQDIGVRGRVRREGPVARSWGSPGHGGAACWGSGKAVGTTLSAEVGI